MKYKIVKLDDQQSYQRYIADAAVVFFNGMSVLLVLPQDQQ
jgi:hypothetical protein